MTVSQLSSQQVYHSFDGFAQMRAKARDGDGEVLSSAAKQLESVFVQMMLKAMRDTVPDGGLFGGEQMDFYEDMFDQQISLNIANGKGIGLAAIIERQLGGDKPADAADDGQLDEKEAVLKLPARSPFTALGSINQLGVVNKHGVITPFVENEGETNAQAPVSRQWVPASPQAFADQLRPFAQQAAIKLGVSENLLIAQAALETGWGQKIMPRSNGGSSFNLFGIKANENWQGDKANTTTLEYRDGIAQRERAAFRAYDSLGQSFDDYVAFLHEQPRYNEVLSAENDADFVQHLQNSGYATDPKYAEKILAVKERLDQSSPVELARNAVSVGGRR